MTTAATAAVRLGVVADDVTGACDLAGRVVEAGMLAVVTIGVPSSDPATVAGLFPGPGSGCAVIALKSRTAPVGEAVAESGASARLLLQAGATLLYQKYCSTFDSTDRGNIGPVADELVGVAGGVDGGKRELTIGTPSTPASGRTQEGGTLFVNGIPLAETSMRDHPLTPMRDSDLPRLLQAQTPHRVGLVTESVVADGRDAVAAAVRELADSGAAHLLTDARTEADLDAIAEAVLVLAAERPVVAAGAAGLATAIARTVTGVAEPGAAEPGVADSGVTAEPGRAIAAGRRLIVSGSASATTLAQNDAFAGERIAVDPRALAADADGETARLRERLASALEAEHGPVLLTATAAPADVARAQAELGAGRAADLIESCLADLAAAAVESLGVTGLIVAGGETSGAVVARLGVSRLLVGAQVAPGVPWTTGEATRAGGAQVALLLKSGNFGGPDLFSSAWEAAS